jgi:hypothetical protein
MRKLSSDPVIALADCSQPPSYKSLNDPITQSLNSSPVYLSQHDIDAADGCYYIRQQMSFAHLR